MRTYIIRFTTKGIKNIDKSTTVDFYNNSISKGKTINLEKRNLKGIFGINGAGKTAYMLALDIYNTITTKSDYLVQDTIKNKLERLINKSTKELFLENIFAISNENEGKISDILKHTIIVSVATNILSQKEYVIKEKLEKLTGNTINTDYELIYQVIDGKLKINNNFDDKELIISEFSNRLEYSTLSSFVNYLLSRNTDNTIKDRINTFRYMYYVYYNSMTTKVFVDKDESYEDIIIDDNYLKKSNGNNDLLKAFRNFSITIKLDEDIINIANYEKYLYQINKLKEFIQILKPTLRQIRIDKVVNGNFYHCKKIFVYDDYEVDEKYESTGIKRIIKMYTYLNLAINGYKIFIDELDANISGVFLDKLLEFYAENGKGQLCFTSHNILSMNILKQYKNSITVFGETGKVVNVVKNGHYQPVNLFYEGFIEDSPFNINSFDFFKSFDMEDDN